MWCQWRGVTVAHGYFLTGLEPYVFESRAGNAVETFSGELSILFGRIL